MLVYLYWPTGAMAAAFAAGAAVASIRFLRTRAFKFDSVSVAMVEAGMLLLALHLTVGVAWDHSISGRWWSWNVPLTSALACGLLYAGYLILRQSVEEPTQRATFCAAFSIFAFLDIPIVTLAVAWWWQKRPERASFPPHGEPVDRLLAAGATAAVALAGGALAFFRMRKEEARRERDAERRLQQAS